MKQFQVFFLILSEVILLVEAQEEDETTKPDLNRSQIWGFGILASIAISLIGFVAAGILVFIQKFGGEKSTSYIIKFLFSLACGALLGDSFAHILAEAYQNQQVISWKVSIILICSILFFILLERSFHAFGITHSHWHNQGDQETKQGQCKVHVDSPSKITSRVQNQNEKKIQDKKNNLGVLGSYEVIQLNREVEIQKDKSEDENGCWENLKGKQSSGYLNLVGSLIHNFIDGLALGIAFSTGYRKKFVPVIIAIVSHQIPRQLGDVAILMKSKFTPIQTILCNGFVNLISVLGGIIGLAVVNFNQATKIYILTVVAGNFIVVSADIWRNMFKNKALFGNLIQFFGFSLGITAMFLLLLLESEE